MANVESTVEAARTFRRTGTALFGGLGMLFLAGFMVWSMATTQVEQSWVDYAIGGTVAGAFEVFFFRVTLWPSVVIRSGAVLVRNPLVDHLLAGGSPLLDATDLGGVTVRDGDVQVRVFALSSSLIDQLTGSRTTQRLSAALADRAAGDRPVALRRDRLRVVRQVSLCLAVGALGGVLVHAVAGGG